VGRREKKYWDPKKGAIGPIPRGKHRLGYGSIGTSPEKCKNAGRVVKSREVQPSLRFASILYVREGGGNIERRGRDAGGSHGPHPKIKIRFEGFERLSVGQGVTSRRNVRR